MLCHRAAQTWINNLGAGSRFLHSHEGESISCRQLDPGGREELEPNRAKPKEIGNKRYTTECNVANTLTVRRAGLGKATDTMPSFACFSASNDTSGAMIRQNLDAMRYPFRENLGGARWFLPIVLAHFFTNRQGPISEPSPIVHPCCWWRDATPPRPATLPMVKAL